MAFLAAGAAAAQSSSPTESERLTETVSPRRHAQQRLQQRVTIELTDQRLEDVVRFLEQATGVTMAPAWREGRLDAGLDRDALITATARNEPALAFLERVLDRAGDPFDPSTWQLSEEGVLQFGPRSELNQTKRAEIYDIGDLLFNVPDFDDRVEIDLEVVLAQGDGGEGSILEHAGEPSAAPAPDKAERAREIVDMLTSLIEPEQWTTNGGEGASVRIHGGTLIVLAPAYIHRQISDP